MPASLNENLLFSEELNSRLNGTYSKGSYSTMQFVLRLRDDIRSALQSEEFDFEKVQASSTSIHENIHWWQHMGSNIGLLLSLSFPAFTSMSAGHLKILITEELAYKSIIKFDANHYAEHQTADIELINLILNNYYDLEYAKKFLLDNKNIDDINADKRFFLNIGHCYHVFWSQTIITIANVLDEKFDFLPKVNSWIPEFEKLSAEEVEGFYTDSSMHVSPIGIKAIYEGQAIFNQMQYLTVALNRDLTYEDFKDKGMLYGIYLEAFEHYLEFTGYATPTNLLDPIVGLFLLICDISINPTNGFPFEVYDFKNFINKNDPGLRFTVLSLLIGKKSDYYLEKLKKYSKEEYVDLCDELCSEAGYASSYLGIQQVLEWFNIDSIKQLLDQEQNHQFPDPNMPIRLIVAKYLRFQEDKFAHPNVLCWFGYHAVSSNGNVDFKVVDDLYKKHHALYVDDYDDEIKPVIFNNYEEEKIKDTFNTFYGYVLLYDLILQWIEKEGAFVYDYRWLSNRSDEMMQTSKENFKNLFDVYPDDIKVL